MKLSQSELMKLRKQRLQLEKTRAMQNKIHKEKAAIREAKYGRIIRFGKKAASYTGRVALGAGRVGVRYGKAAVSNYGKTVKRTRGTDPFGITFIPDRQRPKKSKNQKGSLFGNFY